MRGQWPHDVSFEDGSVVVDGKKISYSCHDTPGAVPWVWMGMGSERERGHYGTDSPRSDAGLNSSLSSLTT